MIPIPHGRAKGSAVAPRMSPFNTFQNPDLAEEAAHQPPTIQVWKSHHRLSSVVSVSSMHKQHTTGNVCGRVARISRSLHSQGA
jgi:hypothetical protein